MIVDDEVTIRQTLAKLVTESGLPIAEVKTASNGLEALQELEKELPHILITDMNMPEINGVELIKKVNSLYKNVKIIVVSGYSDYDYMKNSIRYNAYDYILKPVMPEELTAALKRSLDAINEELNINSHLRRRQEAFLQDLAYGRIRTSADIKKESDALSMNANLDTKILILLAFRQIDLISQKYHGGNTTALVSSLKQTVDEILLQYPSSFSFKTQDHLNICILASFDVDQADGTKNLIVKLSTKLKDLFSLDLLTGVSAQLDSIERLNSAFVEANEALSNFQINTEGSFTNYFTFSIPQEKAMTGIQNASQAFIQAVRNKNNVEIDSSSTRLLIELRQPTVTLSQIRLLWTNIFTSVNSLFLDEQNKSRSKEIFPLGIDTANIIFDLEHFNELFKALTGLTKDILKLNDEVSTSVKTMTNAKNYIDANYHIELSLSEIASRFHFEQTYFSKLFKLYFNKSFMDYLINIRISKACEMLKSTDMKITEIGKTVGYPNPHHFSALFKKTTGYSPSIYRETKKEI